VRLPLRITSQIRSFVDWTNEEDMVRCCLPLLFVAKIESCLDRLDGSANWVCVKLVVVRVDDDKEIRTVAMLLRRAFHCKLFLARDVIHDI